MATTTAWLDEHLRMVLEDTKYKGQEAEELAKMVHADPEAGEMGRHPQLEEAARRAIEAAKSGEADGGALPFDYSAGSRALLEFLQ